MQRWMITTERQRMAVYVHLRVWGLRKMLQSGVGATPHSGRARVLAASRVRTLSVRKFSVRVEAA